MPLQEAEATFFRLLKRIGAQQDWTWEQALQAGATDPQWRAIAEPKDRKAAFEKFKIEARTQQQEREKERLANFRENFMAMLRTHPEVKHYSRYNSVLPIIEGETIFRAAKNDEERRLWSPG